MNATHTPGDREDDFAKIVRASNGQQVLFYKEVEEDGNTLHCVADFDGYHADMKMRGIPDHAFAKALDKADTTMANQVIQQVCEFMGDTATAIATGAPA